MLEKEFEYYKEHQVELIDKYNGRFIVIKGESIIGDYATEEEAYFESIKSNEVGSFLIQLCETGSGTIHQLFHSRVAF